MKLLLPPRVITSTLLSISLSLVFCMALFAEAPVSAEKAAAPDQSVAAEAPDASGSWMDKIPSPQGMFSKVFSTDPTRTPNLTLFLGRFHPLFVRVPCLLFQKIRTRRYFLL